MRSYRKIFWVGLAVRFATLPFLLQWFHADERQMLEFAHFHAHGRLHPFLESRLHLRNQTLPWLFSWVLRGLDSVGLDGPRFALLAMDSLIAVWTWLGFWAILAFLKTESEKEDQKELADTLSWLGWFFALFWGFCFLYSRPLLEAVSFAPTCFLLLALQRKQALRAGFWAGLTGIFRYPSILWSLGAVLFWGYQNRGVRSQLKKTWVLPLLLGLIGFLIAGGFGGWADSATYGKFLNSAPSYWNFNRPGGPVAAAFGNDSLSVYWKWFSYLFTPWLAPSVIGLGAWALIRVPGVGLFCLPYLLGHLWTPHREPRFMLPLTPFLFLALAMAWRRIQNHLGKVPPVFRRWGWGLLWVHLFLNFAWFPIQGWAQWRSAQGVLLRHYSELNLRAKDLITTIDPLIDAWVPPSVRWGDLSCHWHRPEMPNPILGKSLWVWSKEALDGCVSIEAPPVQSRLISGVERIVRVKFCGRWDCGSGEQTLKAFCPAGLAIASEGEPGRSIP